MARGLHALPPGGARCSRLVAACATPNPLQQQRRSRAQPGPAAQPPDDSLASSSGASTSGSNGASGSRHGGAVSLSYSSAWESPVIHRSVAGGEWAHHALAAITSSGGEWKTASFQADGAAPDAPLLEFVISDGSDAWDKAPHGANYKIQDAGRYALRDGVVLPVAAAPVLLVSDLDDTLVGDDAATAAFQAWWRAHQAPAGGRLVYNTGRALDLFLDLLGEKAGVLPEPDLLISSLGTKVYEKAEGSGAWVEDPGYTARLGQGWDLQLVREAAYAALAEVGRDAMHFRPPSEMNEHKVTCGVRADVAGAVVAGLGAALAEQRVAHRLVVSGKGEWRYLDLVPRQAGKLEALEYARAKLGFEHAATVACGDSGNDIDMLEGAHLSVVVGNAQPDLLAWVARRAAEEEAKCGGGARGPLLAEASRAWGVLEGLQRLGFRE